MTERDVALVCLHHAGGHPSVFSSWARDAPRGLEVVSLTLPSADDRPQRRRYTNTDDLLPLISADLDSRVNGREYVLFGQSMGGLLAYLLTRRSVENGGPSPAALVISGYGAPHIPQPDLGHASDDRVLIRQLHRLGGIPDWLAENPVWLTPLLGMVRDDAKLCATYRHLPQKDRLPLPVHVLSGDDDRLFSRNSMLAWKDYAKDVSVTFYKGGHLLLSDDVDEIGDTVFGIALRRTSANGPLISPNASQPQRNMLEDPCA